MVFLSLLMMAIGAVTALSLVFVGLVEAPWPVLLVLLVTGLYSLQRLSHQMRTLADLPAAPDETLATLPTGPEDLKYRGACYSADCTVATDAPGTPVTTLGAAPAAITGYYRGQPWQRSPVAIAPVTAPAPPMVYRGCKVAGGDACPPVEAAAQPAGDQALSQAEASSR